MEKNGIEALLRAEDEAAAIVQRARERQSTHSKQPRSSLLVPPPVSPAGQQRRDAMA